MLGSGLWNHMLRTRGGYYNSMVNGTPASSRLAYYPYEDEWEYRISCSIVLIKC